MALSLNNDSFSLPVSYRFMAVFFLGGFVPDVLDVAFQKISGLSTTITTQDIVSGGDNFNKYSLPTRVTHGNLVLERGLVVKSALDIAFDAAMNTMILVPSNVLVSPLNKDNLPVYGGWLFVNAYPVKWTLSDFDANANQVVIETLEFAYKRVKTMIV